MDRLGLSAKDTHTHTHTKGERERERKGLVRDGRVKAARGGLCSLMQSPA